MKIQESRKLLSLTFRISATTKLFLHTKAVPEKSECLTISRFRDKVTNVISQVKVNLNVQHKSV